MMPSQLLRLVLRLSVPSAETSYNLLFSLAEKKGITMSILPTHNTSILTTITITPASAGIRDIQSVLRSGISGLALQMQILCLLITE
jgi:hypothetical protein